MLSLVTIVKDEEENILNMMSSAADIVDEFVIIDTGSTDRTVELIDFFGDSGDTTTKVFQWGPTTNFAEPRNFGLLRASGDWILHLDADDILLEDGKEAIHNLVQQPLTLDDGTSFNGYCFQIYEDCEKPFVSPSSGRLFKKNPLLKYKGHVHMQIQGGRWALLTDGPHIKHSGYIDQPTRVRKLERNVKLLMLDIQDDPNDPDATYYLAISFKDLGREDEADYWARRALTVKGRPPWVVQTLSTCLKGNKLKVNWYGRN